MAFGDLVKSDTTIEDTATITGDLGSNPTSGNLLSFTISTGITAVTLDTPPVGFTLRRSSTSGAGKWWIYDKISDGTEQTRSGTFSASTDAGVHYAEFDMQGETIDVRTLAENTDNISTNTNSQPSGSVTPISAKNIVLAFHGTDDGIKSDGGQAIDGSWVEDTIFQGLGGSNNAETKISRLVDVSGAQEATHSDTDTGDQMYGAIISYDMVEGSNPIAASEALTFSNIADLEGKVFIQGNESLIFSDAVDLTSKAALMGSESIVFSDVTKLIGKGILQGNEIITFSNLVTLFGKGTLIANGFVTFSDSVTLTVVAAQIQDQFRFGADDGSESAHGWLAAQNVNITQAGAIAAIIRFQTSNYGDFPTQQMKLQVKQTGDPDSNYRDVPVAP